jgi:hypothetical protein
MYWRTICSNKGGIQHFYGVQAIELLGIFDPASER